MQAMQQQPPQMQVAAQMGSTAPTAPVVQTHMPAHAPQIPAPVIQGQPMAVQQMPGLPPAAAYQPSPMVVQGQPVVVAAVPLSHVGGKARKVSQCPVVTIGIKLNVVACVQNVRLGRVCTVPSCHEAMPAMQPGIAIPLPLRTGTSAARGACSSQQCRECKVRHHKNA